MMKHAGHLVLVYSRELGGRSISGLGRDSRVARRQGRRADQPQFENPGGAPDGHATDEDRRKGRRSAREAATDASRSHGEPSTGALHHAVISVRSLRRHHGGTWMLAALLL